jgi:hypothetical protein
MDIASILAFWLKGSLWGKRPLLPFWGKKTCFQWCLGDICPYPLAMAWNVHIAYMYKYLWRWRFIYWKLFGQSITNNCLSWWFHSHHSSPFLHFLLLSRHEQHTSSQIVNILKEWQKMYIIMQFAQTFNLCGPTTEIGTFFREGLLIF